ncbi:hypothetical protein C8J55DRAFT_492784 [Lentinula edodes]|uniref:Uncharacterized protein n=1 Tax=Lentinula lateritia TaxID=40482 RepID=A0A9W8ZUA9_9AGAR|nr:hypothetical protein C8J55DRAFT_492784 [Lentinula edodes]
MYSNNRRLSTSVYSSGSEVDSISISSTQYSPAPSFCAPEDALVQLESYAPSKEIIAYIVDFIMNAVDYTNASKMSKDKPRTRLAQFTAFVAEVVARLPLTTPELLLTVAYVDRAQYRNNSKSFLSYGTEHAVNPEANTELDGSKEVGVGNNTETMPYGLWVDSVGGSPISVIQTSEDYPGESDMGLDFFPVI